MHATVKQGKVASQSQIKALARTTTALINDAELQPATFSLHLLILKHDSTRRKRRWGWSPQVPDILQGVRASLLLLLAGALLLLGCYLLQNGMHGGGADFQYNPDSKTREQHQDLIRNDKSVTQVQINKKTRIKLYKTCVCLT